MAKSEQLQLRVTAEQKARIKEQAALAGEDVSKWVLRKLLPPEADRLQAQIDRLAGAGSGYTLILADIHDLLASLPATMLEACTRELDMSALGAFESNYVAAMIEQACANKGAKAPAWLWSVAPLERPWFSTSLKSLRLYLLSTSPPPFRRRNLFVDSTIGDRV